MNAGEIIELIKKLPPAERAAVVAFARELGESDASPEGRGIPDDRFAEVASQVFAGHRELMRKLAQ